jgi:hypothetical protein
MGVVVITVSGHAMAWCDMVLLCRLWRHCRHGGGSPAVLCDVVSAKVFVIAYWFSRASYRSWSPPLGRRSPCGLEELRAMILIVGVVVPVGLDGL